LQNPGGKPSKGWAGVHQIFTKKQGERENGTQKGRGDQKEGGIALHEKGKKAEKKAMPSSKGEVPRALTK